MFNFLKHSKSAPVATPQPEFIEARSYYGAAHHFVSFNGSHEDSFALPALCGYDNCLPTNSVIPVSAETVIQSWDRQHSGWFWCRDCVAVLFGVPDASSYSKEDLMAAEILLAAR